MSESLVEKFPVQGENDAVNWLKVQAAKVTPQLMERAVAKNVWSAFTKQEAFESGNGFTQRVSTWERTAMTTQPELKQLDQYTATHMEEGEIVTQGWSERAFTVGYLTLRSHNINVINVNTVDNYNEQLAHYMKVLGNHAIQINSDINEQGFAEQCDFKIVLRSEDGEIMEGLFPDYSGTDGKTRWKNLPATACPTNECLERLKHRLDVENASDSTVVYGGSSGPTYQLICSAELSRFLRRGGPSKNADGTDNSDYTDIRYIDSELQKRMAPFGVNYAFNGFQHVINIYAPRYKYDFANARYIRVMPFKKVIRMNVGDSRQAVQFEEWNPEYDIAPFEMFHIYTPEVCRSVVMNLNKNIAGAKFDASSTMGDWEFFSPKDLSNRWGDNGFFQWRMIKGIKPYNTRHGMSVICLRPKYAKLYSTAFGTAIAPGGKNGEDKFFYGDNESKTLAEFDTHIASLEGYNTHTNLHIGLPDIPEDGTQLWTGIGDAVPVKKEWVLPFGYKPRKGEVYEFKPGETTCVIPCIRAEGVTVTASIKEEGKVGSIAVSAVTDAPSPNQVYVVVTRASATEKVSGTVVFMAAGEANEGNELTVVGDGELAGDGGDEPGKQ